MPRLHHDSVTADRPKLPPTAFKGRRNARSPTSRGLPERRQSHSKRKRRPAAPAGRRFEVVVTAGSRGVTTQAERYRVLDLAVDVADATVSRAGERICLPPRTFELLLLLVRRYPHLVRRHEILEAVWPTEHVTEQTLTHRVLLLRQALGDHAEAPRYVAGERGWGYRLLGPVERLDPPAAPPTARPRRAARIGLGGAALALLLVMVADPRGGPRAAPAITLAVKPFAADGLSAEMRSVATDLTEALHSRVASLDGARVRPWSANAPPPALVFEGRVGHRRGTARGAPAASSTRQPANRLDRGCEREGLRGPVRRGRPDSRTRRAAAARRLDPAASPAAGRRAFAQVRRLCLRGEFYWLAWDAEAFAGVTRRLREGRRARARPCAGPRRPRPRACAVSLSPDERRARRPPRARRPRAPARSPRATPRRCSPAASSACCSTGTRPPRTPRSTAPWRAPPASSRHAWRWPSPSRPRVASTRASGSCARRRSSTRRPASSSSRPAGSRPRAGARRRSRYSRAPAPRIARLGAAREGLAECLALAGRGREAAIALAGREGRVLADEWRRLCRAGDAPAADRLRTCVLAAERDRALDALREGVRARSPFLVFVEKDPALRLARLSRRLEVAAGRGQRSRRLRGPLPSPRLWKNAASCGRSETA